MSEPPKIPPEQVCLVWYCNWRGEIAWRRIWPLARPPRFEATEWHPEPQWVFDVWDLDKGAERTFALQDVLDWHPEGEPDQGPPRPGHRNLNFPEESGEGS